MRQALCQLTYDHRHQHGRYYTSHPRGQHQARPPQPSARNERSKGKQDGAKRAASKRHPRHQLVQLRRHQLYQRRNVQEEEVQQRKQRKPARQKKVVQSAGPPESAEDQEPRKQRNERRRRLQRRMQRRLMVSEVQLRKQRNREGSTRRNYRRSEHRCPRTPHPTSVEAEYGFDNL